MRKKNLIFILVFWSVQLQAQTTRDSFVGEWKCYLADETSFEFLGLNSDGTGIKCFGQTVDGKDNLFLDDLATLVITNWAVGWDKLFIESKNKNHFQANPQYQYSWKDGDRLELAGEHILLGVYPSVLTKKRFQRVVVYQKASQLATNKGVKAGGCIIEDTALFRFRPMDSAFQLAEYKGCEDLIPNIIGCGAHYQFIQRYPDPPYSLMIPRDIHRWSFGYGNMNFNISLNSKEGDDPVTSIQIYYDFENTLHNFYFSEMQEGKREKDSIMVNGRSIYRTKNWQGKYEGDIFLDHSLIVSYYTKDVKMQEALQKCIASFQYIK